MIEDVVAALSRELRAAGVRGRAASRVESEARDHLLSSAARHGRAQAVASFGDPRTIAVAVAAQLATTRTRRSTGFAFSALLCSGVAYLAASQMVASTGSPDLAGGDVPWVGALATVGLVLVPQIAFACGLLTLLSLAVTRRKPVLSVGALRVLRRRALVGLFSAGITAGLWAVWTFEFRHYLAATSGPRPLSLALVSLASVPVLGAAAAVVARSSLTTAASGEDAPTALDELETLLARFGTISRAIGQLTPWRFAGAFSALVCFVTFAAGWVAEGDPGSGAARAVLETSAILGCFAALRRPLALARTR